MYFDENFACEKCPTPRAVRDSNAPRFRTRAYANARVAHQISKTGERCLRYKQRVTRRAASQSLLRANPFRPYKAQVSALMMGAKSRTRVETECELNIGTEWLWSAPLSFAIVTPLGELLERINFYQANACAAVGSALDGGISSGRQVKHERRFQRIWRRESILLDINPVDIVLPVVVAGDNGASRIDDCEYRIA